MVTPIGSLIKIDALLDKACAIGLSKKTNIKNVFSDLEKLVNDKRGILINDVASDLSNKDVLERIKGKLKVLDPKEYAKLNAVIGEIQNKGDAVASACQKYGITPKEFATFMEPYSGDVEGVVNKKSPLEKAIFDGNLPFIHILAELGVNMNKEVSQDRTPLNTAIFYNAPFEIFTALKQHGADLNLVDKKGNTLDLFRNC